MIRRIATHVIRWNYRIESTRQRIHRIYKLFVPTRWRAAARWVWGMALVSGVLWWQAAAPTPPLTVYFYDIGQGDAIHVRTAEGFDVLIDGGPTGRVVEKLGRTMPFWDDTIELMVLTHPHADHVVGQIEVLKRFNVEKVLATGVLHTTDEYLAWLEEIKKQKIPMDILRAGMWVGLGGVRRSTASPHSASPEEIVLEILWPRESFEGKRVREGKIGEGGGLNDTSIVARLTYGQMRFLFMGDATDKVEKQLMSSQSSVHSSQTCSEDNTENCRLRTDDSRLHADVLKVGHHGSKYSTSREFLKAVAPRYAVIQVGANRYGHPAFAALHRLEQAGVEVLRNDQDGDITCESDGNTLACQKQ